LPFICTDCCRSSALKFPSTNNRGYQYSTNFAFLLQVAMRALGFEVKKADVLKVLRDYDREGTGSISFEDYNDVSKYRARVTHECGK